MGECAVPLKDKAWEKARKNFEAAMTKAGKKFGNAPRRRRKTSNAAGSHPGSAPSRRALPSARDGFSPTMRRRQ
jgi:hypothetical protein